MSVISSYVAGWPRWRRILWMPGAKTYLSDENKWKRSLMFSRCQAPQCWELVQIFGWTWFQRRSSSTQLPPPGLAPTLHSAARLGELGIILYGGLPGWERPTSPNYWVEERWSYLHGHRGWPRWAVFDRRTLHKTMSLKGRRRWRMVSPLQPPALSLRHRSHSQYSAGNFEQRLLRSRKSWNSFDGIDFVSLNVLNQCFPAGRQRSHLHLSWSPPNIGWSSKGVRNNI